MMMKLQEAARHYRRTFFPTTKAMDGPGRRQQAVFSLKIMGRQSLAG